MRVREIGIVTTLLSGVSYSWRKPWVHKKYVKSKTVSPRSPSVELSDLSILERQAYNSIMNHFEEFWGVSLAGVSQTLKLSDDLLLDTFPLDVQYAFIKSLEEEFDVELPTIKKVAKLTLSELIDLCVVHKKGESVC